MYTCVGYVYNFVQGEALKESERAAPPPIFSLVV